MGLSQDFERSLGGEIAALAAVPPLGVRIAGVDEAGRGPLAGPVVAAACVLPEGYIDDPILALINDSKVLNETKREQIFERLAGRGDVVYSIAIIEAEEIDRINILAATLKGMQEAVSQLIGKIDGALIDGNKLPKLSVPAIAVVGGDGKCPSIAAASVLAKVTRDRLMEAYEKQWPGYGFGKHKGYGTKDHLLKISELGPCLIHRKTFRPISELASIRG